jgi:hypothetical protein
MVEFAAFEGLAISETAGYLVNHVRGIVYKRPHPWKITQWAVIRPENRHFIVPRSISLASTHFSRPLVVVEVISHAESS